MWRHRKLLLPLLLMAVVVALAVALAVGPLDKWLNTAGLLLDIAGIIQLEVSGLFERLMTVYGDEEKWPGGPPSSITRQVIDNPDTPVRTWVRNKLFFESRTGLGFILMGLVFQLAAVWVAS